MSDDNSDRKTPEQGLAIYRMYKRDPKAKVLRWSFRYPDNADCHVRLGNGRVTVIYPNGRMPKRFLGDQDNKIKNRKVSL